MAMKIRATTHLCFATHKMKCTEETSLFLSSFHHNCLTAQNFHCSPLCHNNSPAQVLSWTKEVNKVIQNGNKQLSVTLEKERLSLLFLSAWFFPFHPLSIPNFLSLCTQTQVDTYTAGAQVQLETPILLYFACYYDPNVWFEIYWILVWRPHTWHFLMTKVSHSDPKQFWQYRVNNAVSGK